MKLKDYNELQVKFIQHSKLCAADWIKKYGASFSRHFRNK